MHHIHREKLCALFEADQKGIIYLRGAEMLYRYDTDYEFPFRQESNFLYLTGINEPDCHLIIDLDENKSHLIIPKRDAQFAVWHGFIKTKQDYENKGFDSIQYDSDFPKLLANLQPDTIFCLNDEQAEFIEDLDRSFNVETESLVDAITYCRVIKTPWEMDQLREASRINSVAHRKAMKALEPGKFEYEMKAVFDYQNVRHGLIQDAYNGIFASGKNSAILHYVDNNALIEAEDMFLIDAGFEYNGYASDFTRTYPASAQFSKLQSNLYQIVLDAQINTIEAVKPEVQMENLHMLSARSIMEGLKDLELVKGSVDVLIENDIFALFFPHGLGHFLGLDTHDVGGYPQGVDRIDRPGLKYLRVRRNLEAGMVLTIEPGLYFIPALLEPAFENSKQKDFLNEEALRQLFDFGGIRIEDNLIVTESGYENITDVPKQIDAIEEEMAKA